MKTIAVKERFIELRGCGMSYAKIAEELKVSKQTLIEWAKDFDTRIMIENLQAVNEQALLEKHRRGAAHRLEFYAKHLDLIIAELEKRNYADVPTLTLLDLAEKRFDKLASDSVKIYEGYRDLKDLEDLHSKAKKLTIP